MRDVTIQAGRLPLHTVIERDKIPSMDSSVASSRKSIASDMRCGGDIPAVAIVLWCYVEVAFDGCHQH